MSRLELWGREATFERLERWLRDAGFFAGSSDGLVADLFLGYGLSSAIRRTARPDPPEPCPLPLITAVVRSGNYDATCDNGAIGDQRFTVGAWERTWTARAHAAAVERVREAIGRGDVYQVNLVQHLSAPFDGDPSALAARLASLRQPSEWPLAEPGWRTLSGETWSVVSASPELFLARRGDRLWTMPIKGTRRLGEVEELQSSTKDAAEHLMIVDLERNDLSRVCRPGSVRWPTLMDTEPLAGVEHMVSRVEGTLRDGVGLAEILAATFPGGSVTGAPKIAAVDLIAALEPVGRGASMGALGRVHDNGDFELALTIRTFAIAAGRIHLWVGGGIVWDSDPDAEVDESLAKAEPLLEAIGAPLGSPRPAPAPRLPAGAA